MLILVVVLAISTFNVGILANEVLPSSEIPVEVKDPIEILGYPFGFSLFPGETSEFNITVQNIAPMNYSFILEFMLNDTAYQTKYVKFSSENYNVIPGKQALQAWLTVSQDAAPASLLLTVKGKRLSPSSSTPNPELNQYEFLGGGARWAARDGKTALYINWKDNWLNHSTTDGSDWWWKPGAETNYEILKNAVVQTLDNWGFQVTCSSDIPETLNGYDLVVIEAYYAAEPRHTSLVEEYIANGGGVAILGGVPSYFSVYCKDMWPYLLGGMDLTHIQDWFGSSRLVNTGGIAHTVVDNPVGNSLNADDIIVTTTSHSKTAMTQLNRNAEIIGTWDPGRYVYSYTYEYKEGRVFYQGGPFEIIPVP